MDAYKLMKILSILLILLYLILPVTCLADPCAFHIESGNQETGDSISSSQSDECPLPHDTDDCTTTCCSGHVPLSTFSKISYTILTARLLPYEPHLALPQLIDRIFVPPQNLS
jgi:hypothetical protein